MLWRNNMDKSICINVIFNFCKGLGSYFVLFLYFPPVVFVFTHPSVLLRTPHFPREGLPLRGEPGWVPAPGGRDTKTEGSLWATSPHHRHGHCRTLVGCSWPTLGP